LSEGKPKKQLHEKTKGEATEKKLTGLKTSSVTKRGVVVMEDVGGGKAKKGVKGATTTTVGSNEKTEDDAADSDDGRGKTTTRAHATPATTPNGYAAPRKNKDATKPGQKTSSVLGKAKEAKKSSSASAASSILRRTRLASAGGTASGASPKSGTKKGGRTARCAIVTRRGPVRRN